MLKRISQFSAGRRSKWIVIAVWVIAVMAVGGYAGKLQEATTNENEDYLPESADLIGVWRAPLSCGNFNTATGECGGATN